MREINNSRITPNADNFHVVLGTYYYSYADYKAIYNHTETHVFSTILLTDGPK